MKPPVMKAGEVIKVYELDGKWYEEVCVDSQNTISRPVTQQGVAEATASAERGVYEVLERPQPTPAAESAPDAETPPEAADEADESDESDEAGADEPRVPKRRGRPPKAAKK